MCDELCADISDTYGKMYEHLTTIKNEIKDMEKQMKADEKRLLKAVKAYKPTRQSKTTLTGFAKPGKISEELALFMEKEDVSVLVSRTEATQFIVNYIKDNGLSEGKKVTPNDVLCKLFDVTPETDLTYFSLQKYMTRHFIKD